jgi:hypothetical protein
MQLSAERPCGMNVSKGKDAAFLPELEKTDPPRFARLLRNIFRDYRNKPRP